MSRLIVRNSSLVYPPVPDEIMRDDDIVLPLVDRFEDAMFMAGPGYDALRALFPEFNLRVRRLAREIGHYLPEWLGEPMEGFGHSVWEAYADHFVRFSLGPLLANASLLKRAADVEPDEVLGWELDQTSGWWAGRQMVGEVAEAICTAGDVRVTLSASMLKRILRDTLLPPARLLRVLRYFHKMRGLALPRPRDRTDVLFIVSGPTLVPMLDRIGAKLQSEHGLRVTALDVPIGGPTNPIAAGNLRRWGLHGFSEPSMCRSGVVEALAASQQCNHTAELLNQWPALSRLPAPLQEVLLRRLHSTVVGELPIALYNARLWHAALEQLQPRVLVSFNSYNEALAPAVLQCRHRGIPTICLQHGIWGPLFHAAALLPHDDILIFGDYAMEMLGPLAAEHTDFVATGHCMYDDLDLPTVSDRSKGRLVGSRGHLVVVTTQPVEIRLMVNERPWWLRELARACRRLNAMLAIKPHPHERSDSLVHYEALAEDFPDAVRLVPHGQMPLEELIAASDLMVTRFSTTAFEAALLGKPVMTVNLSGGPDQYPFAEEGCAIAVREAAALDATLGALLTDGGLVANLVASQKVFLRRHIGPRDGRATERIAAHIAARVRGDARG